MIVNKYSGNGGGGGYVLPVASQSTLGGVKIGSGISIDSGGTISAEGGVAQQFIIVDLDAMSQSERADLVTELKAIYDAGSGETINKTYQFYRTIGGWKGLRLQFYQVYYGRCVFGTVVSDVDAQGHVAPKVYEINMWLASDGSFEYTNTYPIAPGSSVSYSQTVTAGTEIGQITIDGSATTIYAPQGGDYVVVEDLSAITNPTEGMVAFVKGTIAVDRLANVSGYKLTGWAGGMAQFVEGEDYTINRSQVNSKWSFPYKTGAPDFTYYWTELDPGVYIRYQGGNLWVAWNSENYPNATMMGNNFTNGDNKWGENSGQTFYITLSHNEGLNQYRGGKWVPMKKQYWFQDCISSSALSEEICHRTAEGEMDITLVENDGVMTCQYSSPNTWNVGSTAFIMLRVDTSSNSLQYYRKFINWDTYNWAQDATWNKTIDFTPLYKGEFNFKYDIDEGKLYRGGSEVTASGIMPYGSFNPGHISLQLNGQELAYYNLEIVENGLSTQYVFPTISRGALASPVTVDDQTFSNEVTLDYGKFVVKAYLNSDFGAGFRLYKRTETQI